jgi:hypothetical protein
MTLLLLTTSMATHSSPCVCDICGAARRSVLPEPQAQARHSSCAVVTHARHKRGLAPSLRKPSFSRQHDSHKDTPHCNGASAHMGQGCSSIGWWLTHFKLATSQPTARPWPALLTLTCTHLRFCPEVGPRLTSIHQSYDLKVPAPNLDSLFVRALQLPWSQHAAPLQFMEDHCRRDK